MISSYHHHANGQTHYLHYLLELCMSISKSATLRCGHGIAFLSFRLFATETLCVKTKLGNAGFNLKSGFTLSSLMMFSRMSWLHIFV